VKRGALQHLSAWEKLLLFIAGCILSSMLFSLIGMSFVSLLFDIDPYSQKELLDLSNIDAIRSIKLINLFFQLGGFLFPSVIFAMLFTEKPNNYLHIKTAPRFNQIGILIILFLALTIFNDWLTRINNQLDLSFISEDLQQKIVYDETIIKQSIYAYIGLSWRSYFVNLFLLAVIPAICEEMAFRGLFQHLLSKISGKIHVGVWLTAFVFAFIHFQFLDFLPRMALGLIFGYIVILTGNLWSSILLHFLNNGFALTLEFLSRKGIISTDSYWFHFGPLSLVISILVAIGLIYLLKKQSKWKEMKTLYLR